MYLGDDVVVSSLLGTIVGTTGWPVFELLCGGPSGEETGWPVGKLSPLGEGERAGGGKSVVAVSVVGRAVLIQ